MTLIIIGILLVGYFLIATEHLNKLNKSSVAMFLGVVGWLLYMLNGSEYVLSMHGSDYTAFLNGGVSSATTIKSFIGTNIFMQYVSSACEVILFVIATSSIIEVLNSNEVFNFLAEWMRTRRSKHLLWMLAVITFLLSANIDNFTTAVTMVLILRKLIPQTRQRIYYSCVILLAANAGGCFTAIGDITSLILWTKGSITPSAFAMDLVLPSLTALGITTWLASRKLPEHITIQSNLGAFIGDDSYLPRWQRLVLLIVGIGGLWAIPTFHDLTKLPPFVGALCVMSLLWVIVQIFTLKKENTEEMMPATRLPWGLQDNKTSQIIFFLGISLAVGAISETGALHWFAGWCDTYIHNVYILTVLFGLISSVLDNIPLVLSSCSMYPVIDSTRLIYWTDTEYMSAFVQNGTYWELLSFCSAMGGSLLTIGSVAGFAVARLERIPFWWYTRRFSWMVLLGWGGGLVVYYLTSLL